ncbi:MAG: hypothetical protein ACTHOJ_18390, partial [Sphingomonas oligoaromativorans]
MRELIGLHVGAGIAQGLDALPDRAIDGDAELRRDRSIGVFEPGERRKLEQELLERLLAVSAPQHF